MPNKSSDFSKTADYIIVGAGPAGCAIARRLADDKSKPKVLLIEAGRKKPSILTKIPAGIALLVRSKNSHNYGYQTVPQAELNGRRGFVPRGKGLGGSSLINAMIYIRGQREDYNEWAKLGCDGWGWDDVFPLFLRSENNANGRDEFHNDDGALSVSDLNSPSPLSLEFINAANECGFATNADFNGASQEGVGLYQVFQKNGQRLDAARAYLGDGINRPNLEIITNNIVQRVIIENNRATGVIIKNAFGEKTIKANREIILSAGAINSPQILMLSGIGPSEHLQSHGIKVIYDAPEIGQNLQDHLDYVVNLRLNAKGLLGFGPTAMMRALAGILPYLKGKGVLTSNVAEAGGFVKSSPEIERPDLQFHFCTAIVDDHARHIHLETGIALHTCILRPKSRGNIKLASANAHDAPLIDPRFLSNPDDMDLLLKGVRRAYDIVKSSSLAKYGAKMVYGNGDENDEELKSLIRNHADTIYHPVGTCRMGSDDKSVVDTKLRVRGISGLRVADASIMPRLISGNTQAPSAMIGEKCADIIIGEINDHKSA